MARSNRKTLRGASRLTKMGCAALLVLLALSGALVQRARRTEAPALDTLSRAKAGSAVRLGIANEAPYGYLDTARGRVTGEAPELARAVLARLGITEVTAVATEFRSLIPGLRAGRFDVIAAGMYVTPARCAEVAFSDPTYRIGAALMVRAGNPLSLHSYADVARDERAVLGLVSGAIEQSYAEAAGVPATRVLALKDASAAVDALRAGHIAAYAGTSLTVRDLLRKAQANDLELAEPFSQPVVDGQEVYGYGALAFRVADVRLRDAFDLELRRFLGSREHLALVEPFGFTASELPAGKRARELCAAKESS